MEIPAAELRDWRERFKGKQELHQVLLRRDLSVAQLHKHCRLGALLVNYEIKFGC